MAAGRSYRQIGRELGICKEVVGGHVKKICAKYLVKTRGELVGLVQSGAVKVEGARGGGDSRRVG
jgi:DNA-binding CsgD family transcriptional regulator